MTIKQVCLMQNVLIFEGKNYFANWIDAVSTYFNSWCCFLEVETWYLPRQYDFSPHQNIVAY